MIRLPREVSRSILHGRQDGWLVVLTEGWRLAVSCQMWIPANVLRYAATPPAKTATREASAIRSLSIAKVVEAQGERRETSVVECVPIGSPSPAETSTACSESH